MDFFASTRALEYFSNSRFEHFELGPAATPDIKLPSPTVNETKLKQKFNIFSASGLLAFAISILIGGVAFYLSWTCNSALEYNIALKIVFGVFAYIFGLMYILLYIVMRYDTCKVVKNNFYY